jgi:DHA1 family inner membrane transport protein
LNLATRAFVARLSSNVSRVSATSTLTSAIPLPLLALASASFGIGTTEFVIMGLLPDVARDLHVTIPHAGLLVTGYALGVVVGAPIVAMLTMRLPRKPTLLAMIATFVLGNLLCAIAPNYPLLMAARIVTAFCHGAYFGIGAVVAADLVAPNRRASAIALMFAGLTVANVLGVPLGTALGQAEGWRAAFWAVVAIGIMSFAAVARWLPSRIAMKTGDLRREVRVLRDPQVALAMLMSVLASASLFTVFTYITPILEHVTNLPPKRVTFVLLLFGVALTVGNVLGGKLADWKLMPSVLGTFVGAIAILAAFTVTSGDAIAAISSVFVWGVVAFALVPLLQMRVVDTASAAPNLASTLNQGAFNLGNATGAWLGGAVLSAGAGYDVLPLVGAAVGALAFGLAVLSGIVARKRAAARYEDELSAA